MHTIHFTASFKGSMSKPVPECQTMLDFAVERDDGSSDNSWISYGMQSCNQITVTNILTLNTHYFAGRMPFPAPDWQSQSTKGIQHKPVSVNRCSIPFCFMGRQLFKVHQRWCLAADFWPSVQSRWICEMCVQWWVGECTGWWLKFIRRVGVVQTDGRYWGLSAVLSRPALPNCSFAVELAVRQPQHEQPSQPRHLLPCANVQ